MQPLDRSETLIYLPELNLNAANPIVQTPDVGPSLRELRTLIGAYPCDLHAQGNDRANDDSDDPLGVSARHFGFKSMRVMRFSATGIRIRLAARRAALAPTAPQWMTSGISGIRSG